MWQTNYIFDVLDHQTGDLCGKNIYLNTLLLLLKYKHKWDTIYIESQGQNVIFFSLLGYKLTNLTILNG